MMCLLGRPSTCHGIWRIKMVYSSLFYRRRCGWLALCTLPILLGIYKCMNGSTQFSLVIKAVSFGFDIRSNRYGIRTNSPIRLCSSSHQQIHNGSRNEPQPHFFVLPIQNVYTHDIVSKCRHIKGEMIICAALNLYPVWFPGPLFT